MDSVFKQTVGIFVLNNFGLNFIWPWPFFVADPDPAHSEATISKCGEVNVVSLSKFIIIFLFPWYNHTFNYKGRRALLYFISFNPIYFIRIYSAYS